MDLSALAGNGPLKRQLAGQIDLRGLSHAYILSGASGSGRRTLAGILAAALVCTGEGALFPCAHCPGCRKASAGIHPDIIHLGADGKDINVAQIRALRSDAYIRPNEAQRKVYLVENAQTMNASAQNAMLKLLEEGPAYAAFLLIADNAALLLPTVRSRCEALSLSPLTQTESEDYLHCRFPDKSPLILREAAIACEGFLGRAVTLLDGSTTDSTPYNTALELLSRLSSGNELSLLELVISLEKWDRDKLSVLLDAFILLLRDALVFGAGGELDPQRRASAEQASHALSSKVLLSAVATAERLRAACGFNVGAGHLVGWLSAALCSIYF